MPCFELYTWGPAFGLPSIDPECLAAIAYLQKALPAGKWALIPCNDPTVTHFDELPVLRHRGICVTGLSSIVGFLRKVSRGEWDLDEGFDEKQRADSIAYATFVESRGAPLLDLSLFVSSENYTNITRGLVGHMLTWPNSWTIPGRLREKAKKRSEHLGLNGLDVDAAAEEQEAKRKEEAGLSGQIPKSLKKDVKSLGGLLNKGVTGNRFRLAGVTDDFLEPMEALLGEKTWLLGTDGPTSLDCLAVGYLALMMKADVPHAWVKTALEEKYPKLGEWVDMGVKVFYGPHKAGTSVDIHPEEMRPQLPWRDLPQRTWLDLGSAMLYSLTSSLPIIGPAYLHPRLKSTSTGQESDIYRDRQFRLVSLKHRQLLYGQIITSCVGITTAMGLLFWAGLIRLPRPSSRSARRDFGAAGSMLGLS